MKGSAKVSVFKLSNHIFDLGLTAKELSIYAYLCSLPSVQNTIDDKAVVKVKQSTIAENCCICASQTVAKVLVSLESKGLIERLERSVKSNKHKGTYTYAIKRLQTATEYFFVDRHVFGKLNSRQMMVYLFICKSYDVQHNDSWNSYNDIAEQTGMKRETVINTINELTGMVFIVRLRRKSKENRRVYVDNHYQIVLYISGKIRKKRVRLYRNYNRTCIQHIAEHSFINSNCITKKVNCQDKSNFFILNRGSPQI